MAEDDLTAISTTGLRWSTVLIIWLISASESSASIWASNASICFQTSGSHTFDHPMHVLRVYPYYSPV